MPLPAALPQASEALATSGGHPAAGRRNGGGGGVGVQLIILLLMLAVAMISLLTT
jgi:hypothetical protein